MAWLEKRAKGEPRRRWRGQATQAASRHMQQGHEGVSPVPSPQSLLPAPLHPATVTPNAFPFYFHLFQFLIPFVVLTFRRMGDTYRLRIEEACMYIYEAAQRQKADNMWQGGTCDSWMHLQLPKYRFHGSASEPDWDV